MTKLSVEIGKALVMDVDTELLAPHAGVMDHVMMIGLRNILMDSHASVKREDFKDEMEWRNASKAKAEMKLAAMLRGEIRANERAPRVATDPIGAEAVKIAKAKIMPLQKNAEQVGKWAKSFELANPFEMAAGEDRDAALKAVLIEAVKRYAAKPEVRATAKANVEAMAAIESDMDL